MTSAQWRLVVSDLILIGILTVIGFLSHRESPFTPRLLATWIPFSLAWFWVAFPLGLFAAHAPASPWRAMGRVWWGWSLAAPLGALMRAVLLGDVVIPAFVAVIFTLHSITFALWRGLLAARLLHLHPQPAR